MPTNKNIIFRCSCGHPSFMEFDSWSDEDGALWISTYENYTGIWSWIKQLFRGRVYHTEAILDTKDIDILIKYLEEIKNGKKDKPRKKSVSSGKKTSKNSKR